MAKTSKSSLRGGNGIIEVKSKFDAEFRRFSVDQKKLNKFDDFRQLVEHLHFLQDTPFVITYTDVQGDLLPINNDDNYHHAISQARPVLRLMLQRKGESYAELNGYGAVPVKKRNPISKLMSGSSASAESPVKPRIRISQPEDFRRVSAIIDVDIIPETHRRVKLMKNGSDRPLGFYIRDGTSMRLTPHGLEKVPGIYISRLVPGGLAESTGLLAVNDEVLEVNGIEVTGKTLDQVTDMMVANSSNLIITVKPANQRMTLAPARGGYGRQSQTSQASSASYHSTQSTRSGRSNDSGAGHADITLDHDDEDEVHDHLSKNAKDNTPTVTL